MTTIGRTKPSGRLSTQVMRAPKAPFSWRLKNTLRWDYLFGWVANQLAHNFSKLTGIPTIHAQLSARLTKANGQIVDFGVLCHKVVTTAFVEFAVDNLVADTAEWGNFNFHDSGIGTTGPVIGDTDIETTDGEARVAGSQVEGATAEIYRTVGTIAYTSTLAITEHGVFSIVTGGTLMDRSTFSAINVENGDSIQFTYELTIDDGG